MTHAVYAKIYGAFYRPLLWDIYFYSASLIMLPPEAFKT